MDIKELTKFSKEQLERTNYWLAFAEAKNGALIAVNIAMMTIIVHLFSCAPYLCAAVLICLTGSSLICLKSFFPNLSSHSNNTKADGNTNTLN